MVWYLERIQAEHEQRLATRAAQQQEEKRQALSQWEERLTPLEERLKKLLDVPEGFKVVSILSLGHPTRPHRPRPRLALQDLVFTEKWGEPYYKEEA